FLPLQRFVFGNAPQRSSSCDHVCGISAADELINRSRPLNVRGCYTRRLEEFVDEARGRHRRRISGSKARPADKLQSERLLVRFEFRLPTKLVDYHSPADRLRVRSKLREQDWNR